MEILINNEQDDLNITDFEGLIRDAFTIAAKRENLDIEVEVSVSFVNNEIIQELNRDYRDLDVPTDVLSFPQDNEEDFCLPKGFPKMLGDIIISTERAKEQAKEYGHGVTREVVYLAIHGFLHLAGYDHETEEEQKVMREQEETILKELDLGRDY